MRHSGRKKTPTQSLTVTKRWQHLLQTGVICEASVLQSGDTLQSFYVYVTVKIGHLAFSEIEKSGTLIKPWCDQASPDMLA